MPLSMNAIYTQVQSSTLVYGAYLSISGATAGNTLVSSTSPAAGSLVTSIGYVTVGTSGKCLIICQTTQNSQFTIDNINSYYIVKDTQTNESVATWGGDATLFRDSGTWTMTQDSSYNIIISCTSLGASSPCPRLLPLESTAYSHTPPEIWEISLLDRNASVLATANVKPPLTGELPQISFGSSVITITDNYFTKISRRFKMTAGANDYVVVQIASVLTASAVTSGGSSNMFSWLDNSYWYLTDLQVNLGTRAVTNRQGTIDLRPSDTINFAILFHDGAAGINPQATDIKLAVRSSNNTSPYHFWSASTVSTVTVSGDVYYAITVTASDDDLLTAQAANLLAGSNASQSLLGEIQWTTTRGTFSSDTFTINVPSEVVREPDV